MLIGLLKAIVFFLCSFTIMHLIIWLCKRSDCYTKIRFKQFKGLYPISPERWDISDHYCVRYSTHNRGKDYDFPVNVWLYFSPTDTLCYIVWRLRHKNNENRIETNRHMKELAKNWQIDIDEYRERYGVK